jgi:UDP-N-acetylmuramoyl-L-alanyl-D-glutamate--2,6-diaminopimelate ligase
MQLLKILSAIPFYTTNQPITEQTTIHDIQMDHRLIKQGDMFICIKGFTVDGHQFAEKAVANGATVLIAEKALEIGNVLTIVVPDTIRALALFSAVFYRHPTTKFPLIGITGTNGKTTITYLLEHIFQTASKKTGIIGTIQVKIGNETLEVKNTTPDALQLQRIFNQMVKSNVDIAMMEVSSHALDLGRVYGCDFDIAVFTNLTQDHLDYHKDMDDYLRAKTLLFTGLGNSYQHHNKYAVLNKDDIHSPVIAKSTSQPIITYGIENEADVMATDIMYHVKGMHFTLVTPSGNMTITSRLMGKFNIYNMLAAVSVALLRQVPVATIKHALESMPGIAGRFEQVDIGQDYAVIVDYAHTPDSLENVLTTIEDFKEQKVYVVVGTGGDRDKKKRPLMAKVAVDHGDWVIFTSDNPRTEAPGAILQDMTTDLTAENYEVIKNRGAAIKQAIGLAKTGDVILIAGKGHETYQEINGVRYDFDDRLVAKVAIKQKGL